MPTIAEMCEEGLGHHQAGRLTDAERIYRAVLAADPNHVDALHLLGVVASQVGQHEMAVVCIRRAIELTGRSRPFIATWATRSRRWGNWTRRLVRTAEHWN